MQTNRAKLPPELLVELKAKLDKLNNDDCHIVIAVVGENTLSAIVSTLCPHQLASFLAFLHNDMRNADLDITSYDKDKLN